MKWSNEAWKKLCSAIKGLYTQKKLICFIALFCVIVLKTYTTSWFPTFFFFFQVERLLLLQMYWNIFFLLPKHLWWVSVQLMMMVSVQCLFFKEAFGRLVSTSQWLPFSEDVCIIVIFFYLPFCQYLVWKVAYCPLLSSFFPSSSFQICNVPISCLLVRTQSGLVFPIRGRVCVRAQASCLCFLTVFVSLHS